MSVARALHVAVVSALVATAFMTGCDRQSAPAAPPPSEVQAEATGYYCGMLLVDHEGPKGQIHLAGRSRPVWFSSVRDTIAFTRLPEEPRDITAIYVNDMARAKQWEQPDRGAWIEARQAWFVIDSDMRGGMGAPEAVPFSDQAAAEAFRVSHQGRVVRLADVPDTYVLGPMALPAASSGRKASAAQHSK